MHFLKPAIPILFSTLALMSGCAKRQENLTPADERLVPVYSELVLFSEEYKSPASSLDSTTYQHQVDSILTKNGLTRERFFNQIRTLAQSPLVYQQFTEKVRKDLERRKSKVPS